MKYNSRAIALTYINYRESSIIARLFTEKKGVQTFLVKGVRSKKKKLSLGFFQPLQLVEINASYIEKKTIQYLNEIVLAKNTLSKSFSTQNTFLSLFISEIMSKVLYDCFSDKNLFEFIWATKKDLIKNKKKSSNYPLYFLLHLSNFLGFYPSLEDINNPYFDLKTGEFVDKKKNTVIGFDDSESLKVLLKNPNEKISYEKRKSLLRELIRYYYCQNHEIKNLNSHLIIESLRL